MVLQEIFNMKKKKCLIILSLFSLLIFAQTNIDYAKSDPIKYVTIKEKDSGFLYPKDIEEKKYENCYVYFFDEKTSNGVKTIKFYADYWFSGEKKLKQSCFEINNKKFYWKSDSLNNIFVGSMHFIVFENNRENIF